MTSLDERIAGLASMTPTRLRVEWLRLYKVAPPAMTADLLRRGIAYRLQERARGAMSGALLRDIEQLCKQYERTGEAMLLPAGRIKAGTRLVRDWGGNSHHVVVLEDGFLYQDRRYGSLSQIAFDITGTKWSGPRFFGLVDRKKKSDA
jgi:hypothetical protein